MGEVSQFENKQCSDEDVSDEEESTSEDEETDKEVVIYQTGLGKKKDD